MNKEELIKRFEEIKNRIIVAGACESYGLLNEYYQIKKQLKEMGII